MRIFRHIESAKRHLEKPVLTLGNFDGVHRGHQEILARTVALARELGGSALALTFEPHPAAVLMPAHAPKKLMDLHTRVAALLQTGIDAVLLQRFSPAFAAIEAEAFVREWLVGGLGVRGIVVGHRVRFGHFRRGDAALLQRLGPELGVRVEIIGKVEVAGRLVSSSAIRSLLSEGNLALAKELLGRPHTFSGRVVHGRHRGKALGFPTANLPVDDLVLPPDGVYLVRACLHERWLPAVANLGSNPTFGDVGRQFEVHLLDFDQDIYGRRLTVQLLEKLRDEIRFPSLDALREQIAKDVARARALFACQ
jgi:riboflavin kinase/FMN adenylyltransferase